MAFRTLWCPLCNSRWKVVPAKVDTQVPMTCVSCEERLPQMVHEADYMELEDMEGPDESEGR